MMLHYLCCCIVCLSVCLFFPNMAAWTFSESVCLHHWNAESLQSVKHFQVLQSLCNPIHSSKVHDEQTHSPSSADSQRTVHFCDWHSYQLEKPWAIIMIESIVPHLKEQEFLWSYSVFNSRGQKTNLHSGKNQGWHHITEILLVLLFENKKKTNSPFACLGPHIECQSSLSPAGWDGGRWGQTGTVPWHPAEKRNDMRTFTTWTRYWRDKTDKDTVTSIHRTPRPPSSPS